MNNIPVLNGLTQEQWNAILTLQNCGLAPFQMAQQADPSQVLELDEQMERGIDSDGNEGHENQAPNPLNQFPVPDDQENELGQRNQFQNPLGPQLQSMLLTQPPFLGTTGYGSSFGMPLSNTNNMFPQMQQSNGFAGNSQNFGGANALAMIPAVMFMMQQQNQQNQQQQQKQQNQQNQQHQEAMRAMASTMTKEFGAILETLIDKLDNRNGSQQPVQVVPTPQHIAPEPAPSTQRLLNPPARHAEYVSQPKKGIDVVQHNNQFIGRGHDRVGNTSQYKHYTCDFCVNSEVKEEFKDRGLLKKHFDRVHRK